MLQGKRRKLADSPAAVASSPVRPRHRVHPATLECTHEYELDSHALAMASSHSLACRNGGATILRSGVRAQIAKLRQQFKNDECAIM